MNEAVPYILLGWLGLSVLMFRWMEPLKAGLVCALGGWALLPAAAFNEVPSSEGLPVWWFGTALPSAYILTKASTIGVGLWLGLLIYRFEEFRRWHPQLRDVPLIVFCCAPLLTAWANGLSVWQGAGHALYLMGVWGGCYFWGRFCLKTAEDWRQMASMVVLAGLVYLPIGLVEWGVGPVFYEWIYGFHPFRQVGHIRYFGYRPLGFLEDGNQVGMWVASAALVGVWIHRSKAGERLWGVSTWVVSTVLVGMTLLFQSVGSIVLLAGGWLGLEWSFRVSFPKMRRVILVGGLLFAVLGVVHVSNLFSINSLKSTVVGSSVGQALKGMGRGSLAWRIKTDQQNLDTIMEKPILGWGRANWWQEKYHIRPWGLWMMVWGMYGLVGLGALALLLLWPFSSLFILHQNGHNRRPEWCFVFVLGVGLLINILDGLLNCMFIVPLTAIAGGLANISANGGLSAETHS